MADFDPPKTEKDEQDTAVLDLQAILEEFLETTETGAAGSGEAGGTSGSTSIPDGTTAVVVDGSGQVVGTATFNASTGAFEQSGVDTTVVVETAASVGSGSGSAGGFGEESTVGEPPTSVGSPPGERPVRTSGSIPFIVPPQVFHFHPVSATKQDSDCVHFALIFRIGGSPVGSVPIAVRIQAPRFIGGTPMSAEVAAARAALAVTEAAPRIVEALDLMSISTFQAQGLFEEELADVFRRMWGGQWSVFRCGF